MAFLGHNLIHLYGSEKSRLKRFIDRIISNSATADDLVQEAFSKLIDASHRQNIHEPSAYLTRAARNLALNHLRHLQQGVEVTIDDQIYHAIADRKPSPEMEVIYRQELRRLLTALSNLPPRRREIFIIHRFEEVSYSEIAERFQLSRRTVINHIFNALDDLDQALGSDFLQLA